MSRPHRVHVPNGTYYVVQHSMERRPVFSNAADVGLFESLLRAVLQKAGAQVCAYCWTKTAMHFVVVIDQVRLASLMQGVNSRFAQQVHRRTGEKGPVFLRRYHSVLIDPDAYLLQVVRYIHYLPVFAGCVSNPEEYVASSHHAYLHLDSNTWVDTRVALRQLDSDDGDGYREFMSEPPPLAIQALFEHGSPGVLGSSEFLEALPRAFRRYSPRLTLDDVAHKACLLLGVSLEHVLSLSRQRDLALARSLIGWYASERHIASLSEVARYLRRAPSTLSAGIARCQELRPDLFVLDVFRHQVPLATVREVGIVSGRS